MAVETRETRIPKSLDQVQVALEQSTCAIEEMIVAVSQAEMNPELEEAFTFSLQALKELIVDITKGVRDQTVSLAMFKGGLEAIIGHE